MKQETGGTLVVREALESDKPTLLEFEQALIAAERPMDPTIRQEPVRYYDMDELISNPEVHFLVAEKDDRLVGCGYVRPKDARHYLDHQKYAYLGFMYTAEPFRGQGINQEIVKKLKKWATNRGLTEFRLTVYETNLPAIRAYEKVGFERHLIEMRLRES